MKYFGGDVEKGFPVHESKDSLNPRLIHANLAFEKNMDKSFLKSLF